MLNGAGLERALPAIAGLALLGAWTHIWGVSAFVRFAWRHRMTAANYRGEQVPTAGGLLLWLLLAGGFAAGRMTLPAADLARTADFAAAASLVAGAGLLDDLIGQRDIKGIGGHLREWRRTSILTTGICKLLAAAGGAFLVLLPQADRHMDSLLLVPLQALLIMLSANSVNLLDLRPGRAGKAALLVMTATAVWYAAAGGAGPQANALWLSGLWPVMIGAGILLVPDLRRRLMLGDTGANLLGFAAGVAITQTAAIAAQAVICGLLLLLHLYTARRSLTVFIARHRLLHWLDEMGRPRERA
ncbi:Glycosyl transferase family 4 [Paenibacillus sp. UNCCL117]|uniref:hypothetical protein n=1 Tax=unclassified Paenibacillus TaxID=185978 RepID=UPI000880226E|nr:MULTISPECIES: hypothetical protein [unclassified Paenibacillus]SDC37502.1 Glycosyl transferase family 4 [Paenibacillus sp. cl123]SFW14688.1 Glycosyl transferase family 4 [Paenibacillus sp. UNCCL117]